MRLDLKDRLDQLVWRVLTALLERLVPLVLRARRVQWERQAQRESRAQQDPLELPEWLDPQGSPERRDRPGQTGQ